METEELQTVNIHHGRNIKRARMTKNIKQEALSDLVHLSQSAVSKYERMRVIDNDMLERFAKALNVPVDYLKTMEDNASSVVFENITNNNSDNAVSNTDGVKTNEGDNSDVNTINDNHIVNPLDKIIELYERLLQEKDEKYAAIERRIQSLEQNK